MKQDKENFRNEKIPKDKNIFSEGEKTHFKDKAITSIMANNEIISEGTREINKAKIIEILKKDRENENQGLSSGCFARIIGTDPGSVTASVKELRDNEKIEIVAKERRPGFIRTRHIYKLSGSSNNIQIEVAKAV